MATLVSHPAYLLLSLLISPCLFLNLIMDYYYLLCFVIVVSYVLPVQFFVEATTGGFSVEIIHRDSQLSPFYNHSATPGDLSRNDALHSIARANHFRPFSLDDENKIQSAVIPDGAGYLMKLSIGSPPIEVLAVADTGSDLVWIQCQPCEQCYPQDDPVFDPMKSSTYMELSCDSKPCQDLPRSACGNTQNECQYSYGYEDGSKTNGALATDTFTFDSTDGQVAAFPNSVFGCGHNNSGLFSSRGSGLVGLGGGPLSLISQLGAQIEQKFSYCLLPRTVNSASELKFGSDAVLSGPGVVSTPFLSDRSGPFYYLTLEGISVGDKKIVNSQMAAKKGNIIIDSGTTLTFLESSFYNDLEAAVNEAIGLNPVQDPQGDYNLCYDKSSFSVPAEMTMVFHFTGGADVMLKPLNIFTMLDYVTCLAMLPIDGSSVYGNWAQMNFQVEYDLGKKQVSFAPADCSQY